MSQSLKTGPFIWTYVQGPLPKETKLGPQCRNCHILNMPGESSNVCVDHVRAFNIRSFMNTLALSLLEHDNIQGQENITGPTFCFQSYTVFWQPGIGNLDLGYSSFLDP